MHRAAQHWLHAFIIIHPASSHDAKLLRPMRSGTTKIHSQHLPRTQAPVPRSSFMSKRLAAMTISDTGQSGALLPPPPTAAKLEPRSLSGPLDAGSSSAGEAAPDEEKPTNESAEEQQGSNANDAAAESSDAASIPREQQPQHAVPASEPPEGKPIEKCVEEDEQFGSFVVA